MSATSIAIHVQGERTIIGAFEGDTFTTQFRTPALHGFRGGEDSWAGAVKKKTAAWGVDLKTVERLRDEYGVRFVCIPTPHSVVYRTSMDLLLGPKSFEVEYGGYRRQTVLNLAYWEKTRSI